MKEPAYILPQALHRLCPANETAIMPENKLLRMEAVLRVDFWDTAETIVSVVALAVSVLQEVHWRRVLAMLLARHQAD